MKAVFSKVIIMMLVLLASIFMTLQNASAKDVCARGYIKALRVLIPKGGSHWSATNVAVYVDGAGFKDLDQTDHNSDDHFIMMDNRRWISISYGRAMRWSTFLDILSKAFVAGAPVRIISRQNNKKNNCAEDDNKFEVKVCLNEQDCNH